MRAELELARSHEQTDWPAVAASVETEVERLGGLVDDLVLIARMSERRPATEAFAIADAVRDVGARRRSVPVRLEGSSGDLLDADGPSMPDIEVDGDPGAVRQALDHLVANAARHATSFVEISIDATPETVTVHVDDDGPGIAPADRERVLQRFVRLDEARSRDRGGSGLGLAVAAEVAAAHGGSVVIGERPGGGARVSMTVRRSRIPAQLAGA
jgi:signal transduction histidine kinase